MSGDGKTTVARKKEFDVEAALERAKDAFWAEGYDATSMESLLKCMGINRGSFYGTFKSKRDVLIKALRLYDSRNRASLLRQVSQGRSPREALSAIFHGMIDGSRGPQGRHGCFLVNSALEVAPKDVEVARIVRDGFRDVEQFLAELIRRGQKSGEFRKELDAEKLGRTLMSQLVGLLVLVRAGASEPTLKTVVQQASDLLT